MDVVISWIFSVVVVSFLINIISNYVQPFFDNRFNRFFAARKYEEQTRKAIVDSMATHMLNDPQELAWYNAELTRMYIMLYFMILGFVVVVLGSPVDKILAAFFHHSPISPTPTDTFITRMILPLYNFLSMQPPNDNSVKVVIYLILGVVALGWVVLIYFLAKFQSLYSDSLYKYRELKRELDKEKKNKVDNSD